MNATKFIHVLLACCILPIQLNGQIKTHHKHYSTKDGLSHGSVINIMQDNNGFMWFNTWDGLNRFDGVNFKVFKTRPGDNLSLSSNRIDIVKEDKWNALWIKTYDSKIFRLKMESEEFDETVSGINDSLHGDINQLYLSSQNEMWFTALKNGMYRIKTDSITQEVSIFHYHVNAPSHFAITGNQVQFIAEDCHKNIWCNTDKGILKLSFTNDYKVEAFTPHCNSIFRKNSITTGFLNRDKMIFGTKNGNILVYNSLTDSIEVFKTGPYEISVLHGSNNFIYAGSIGNGLIVIDMQLKKKVQTYKTGYLTDVYKIFEDSHGFIWLETNETGTVKVDPIGGGVKHFTQQVDVGSVIHIISNCRFIENKDVLWLSLKGGGFGYYDRQKDKLEYFYNEPGSFDQKISNFVVCFYFDNSGVLWLSTYRKGIEKFTLIDNSFHFFKPEINSNNDLVNEVRTIFEDHLGYLWLGSKSGDIYMLDEKYQIVKNISKEYKLNSTLVYSIIEDNRQNIWLGTKGNGIYYIQRLKNNQFSIRQFLHEDGNPNSLSNNNVYSLMQDDDGKIWVGTYGGGLNILQFQNGEFIFKNEYNAMRNFPGLSGKRIRQINKDSRGNVWLATTEGLIFTNPNIVDKNGLVFSHFKKQPNDAFSLGNNDVYCIFSDTNDTLWFGTLGGGLNKLIQYPEKNGDARFKVYTTREGLSSDVIFSIESDKDNNLWMSTENGLIKFDQHTHKIKTYNENDGLYTSSFSEASSAKRKNGDLVFGAYNGIFYFNPQEIEDKKIMANLRLTELKLLNNVVQPGDETGILKKSITFTNELSLKHDQNIIELSFALLEYTANDKLRYEFILEGFDNHWRQTDFGNVVYTKLPPGGYTFKVKIDNPGLNQLSECNLNITIKKPYWKSTLAYIFYSIILLVAVFIGQRILLTMIKLRNNVLIEKQLSELKIQFFTNISHELRTPLTLIQGPVLEINQHENLSEKGHEYIRLIKLNTERMLRLVNQLLDFRKIQFSKMRLKLSLVRFDLFVEQICNNFNSLAVEKDIDYVVNLNGVKQKVWIDEEKMDIVIFNLLSNAFKFTPEGKKIHVSLESDDNKVRFVVTDQGIGIDESKRDMVFESFANIHDPSKMKNFSTGLGLSLSKELIELHRGKINFHTSPVEGTTFYVEIFTGKDHFDGDNFAFIDTAAVLMKETDRSVQAENKDNVAENHPDQENSDKIVIVEDNSELRTFVKSILAEHFNVLEAQNGREGYDMCIEHKPNMVISDVMMPEMDGIELLNKLRNNFETSHIPVILLTAKSSVESRIEGIKFGADAYVTKPFNSLHLLTLIQNLLELRKRIINKYSGSIKMIDFSNDEIVVTDKDGEFLKNVIDIIDENLSDPEFKIEVVSKSLGMGRTNFFNKVKGLTNLSPIDFIKEYRLNKAQHFLDSGVYNISEASYKAGFNDPGYFSKCFKEKFGKSPSQYIKNN